MPEKYDPTISLTAVLNFSITDFSGLIDTLGVNSNSPETNDSRVSFVIPLSETNDSRVSL